MVARRLGIPYLDTGALYRAAAWAMLKHRIAPTASDAVIKLVGSIQIFFIEGPNGTRIWLDGVEATSELRSPEVTKATTPVCEIHPVREKLVSLQRAWAKRGFGVVEGRDIGTVVFPQAGLKIFMTARPEIRALRRARDLGIEGDQAKISALAAELAERDRRDSERQDSPLRQAPDMVVVDTSDQAFSDQVNTIIRHAGERFGVRLYGAAAGNR